MDNYHLAEHVKREEQRLERIEQKIDKLSDALINLARAEEKLINIDRDNIDQNKRLTKHSERMTELEGMIQEQGKTIKVVQFVMSVGTTLIVGAVLKIFFGS